MASSRRVRPQVRPIIVVTALTLTVGAACDRAAAPDESVALGSGSMPATFPSDFPVPADAVIGATLVDRVNHRTEANLNLAADLVSAVQFFQVGLVNEGYVVQISEGDDTSWRIEFARGDLRGVIEMTGSAGITGVFVEMNVG